MLTGDEQIWKEVQESLKQIEELKAHWSILSPAGPASCWLLLSREPPEPGPGLKALSAALAQLAVWGTAREECSEISTEP